jgi:hypothetical protein
MSKITGGIQPHAGLRVRARRGEHNACCAHQRADCDENCHRVGNPRRSFRLRGI